MLFHVVVLDTTGTTYPLQNAGVPGGLVGGPRAY